MLKKNLPGFLATPRLERSELPSDIEFWIVDSSSRRHWEPLYRLQTAEAGVNTFPEIIWDELAEGGHGLKCVLAMLDGESVGCLYFSEAVNVVHGRSEGRMESLFVIQERRGMEMEVELALLDWFIGHGSAEFWRSVEWNIGDDDYAGRKASERVADGTTMNHFYRNLDEDAR